MQKNILIIGDSMAMPRNEVAYNQTWIYKLISHFSEIMFIDKSRRGSTTERIVQEGGGYKNVQPGADLLEYYKPNLVVIQLGIVDCSPRLVSRNALSTKLINHSPTFVKTVFYRFKKKYSVRKPKNAFVSPQQFKNNFETYIKRAKAMNTRVLAIEIAPVAESFVEKSPSIVASIAEYNKILEDLTIYENFSVVSSYDKKLSNSLLIDELHLNEKGHEIIFSKLKKELCQI